MWRGSGPVATAEPGTAGGRAGRGPRGTARLSLAVRRAALLLLALSLASGCASLRSQPRFTGPGKEKAREEARERRKGADRASQDGSGEIDTRRRKDARRGGGLPVLKLFSRDASDLVAVAERFLGTPYRYGGDTERGMDCSGMVWRVVKEAWDVELPRSSSAMAQLGMPVSRGELQADDLVFFATSGGRRISHVGIYGGDGRFIHSSTTQGVEWNTLEEGYWRRHLVTARRLTRESLSP